MTIHYKISPCDSAAHLFSIELTIPSPNSEGQLIWLPCWIPG
ncbi:MAG: hypothetical protein ACRC01_10055, partial [Deefgea sp.]